MKKWLEILQLLVLIIICIVFIFYTFMKKESDTMYDKIVEKFQVATETAISTTLKNGDTRYKYFDISANYYEYNTSETGNNPQPATEAQILNVGGSFGTVDLSIIPWDAENAVLTSTEALWGVVPPEASKTLFNKVYAKTQMDNMDTLPFDEASSQYHFEDPMFSYGTNDKTVGALLQTADALTQLALPMAMGHFTLPTNAGMKEFDNMAKDAANARKGAMEAVRKEGPKGRTAAQFKQDLKASGDNAAKKSAEKSAVGSVEKRVKNELEMMMGRKGPMKENKLLAKLGEEMEHFKGVAMKALTTERMKKWGSAMKESKLNKAWKEVKGSIKKALFGAKGAEAGAMKAMLKKLGKTLGGKILKKAFTGLMIGAVISFSLAWIPFIGEELDLLYNIVITPMLIIMTLPYDWAPITKLTKSLADADGCCPAGAEALDIAIPSIAETLISMIPIIGDIFGIIYPFMCMELDTGALLPKHKLIMPKYLNYAWLSCYHLDWPQYNCTNGNAKVQGKYWDTSRCGVSHKWVTDFTIPFVGGYLKEVPATRWSCGPYTDLNDIIRDPDGHKHIAKRLEGFTPQYDIYNVIPPGTKFFYCDFSDPNILVQMAQFYYDYASRSPSINSDGTVTISYISKINYVCSSSLVTCDILCEMSEVSFNPYDGGQYSEVITYEHDRRFYFGIDSTIDPPLYWEDTRVLNSDKTGFVGNQENTAWKTIDDNYDIAMFALNDIIHSEPFNNFVVSAELLVTGYKQMMEASNVLAKATAGGAAPEEIIAFTAQFHTDQSNYNDVLYTLAAVSADTYVIDDMPTKDINVVSNAFNREYISELLIDGNLAAYTLVAGEQGSSEAPPAYHITSLGVRDPTPTSANPKPSQRKYIEDHISTVIGFSNAYWEYQLEHSDDTKNTYTQYKLYGCTHLDSTANCAYSPDVSIGEVDLRKQVDFDVRPFIKRCQKTSISMRQCMDAGTIDSVVKQYMNDHPTKRIKAITNIEPKGRNVCQYKWDEVDYNATNYLESNYTSKTNNVLFQIDLSSCAFELPRDDNYNVKLIGANVGGVNSDSITHIESLSSKPQLYVNPTRTTYKNANGFDQTDEITQYYNPNKELQYIQTFFYEINLFSNVIGPLAGGISSTVLKANVDDIVRYDPESFLPLPKIVRPQKPIRFHYPKPEETATLGGKSNDVCSLPANLQNFILDYNSHNVTSKMLKITRAYTTDAGRCDVEADVMTGNNVSRISHTFDMKLEQFVDVPYVPPQYTYDQLDPNFYGLNIQPDTKTSSNLSNNGFLFSKPYVLQVGSEVQSNNTFFNDDLIKVFTSNTAGLKNATSKLLVDIVRTDYLGSPHHCYNYPGGPEIKPVCKDPEIQQRIMEQYNVDNFPKGRYDTTQNSALAMVASATNSSNTCHVVFENEMDKYVDAYSPNTTIYGLSNEYPDPASNYWTENRLYFKEVQMKQLPGTCTFVPVPGQQYIDISASDLALSTQFDMGSLTDGTTKIAPVYPKRPNCKVFCGSNALMKQALSNYSTITGSHVDTVIASMPIGYDTCDYYVHHDKYMASDGISMYDDIDGILRVKYDTPVYFTTDHNCELHPVTYTAGNYQVQVAGDTVDSSTADLSPLFTYMIDPMLSDEKNINFKQYVNDSKKDVNFPISLP